MKVLHILAINGIGGAENLLIDILPLLNRKDIEVQCIIFFSQKAEQAAKDIGGKVEEGGIDVKYREYSNVIGRGIFDYITGYVNANGPDLIHVHLKHAEFWLAFLKWTGRIKTPIVMTSHGYRDRYLNRHGLTWDWKHVFTGYYWLNRFIFSQFNIILISHALENFYRKCGFLGGVNYTIVYHGTPRTETISRNGKPFNYEIVLPGRMIRCKGHQYLIDAVEILKKDYPGVSAHFYGIGPEMNRLQSQVRSKGLKDSIHFHGFVNDVVKRISSHDIAVIPSTGEAFGLVFFDAFKASLPVVAFDLQPCNEIIEDEHNGLLAEPLNTVSLVGEIKRLFEDQELRTKLAGNAVEVMRSKFTIEKMAEEYRDFYVSVLEKAKRKNLN